MRIVGGWAVGVASLNRSKTARVELGMQRDPGTRRLLIGAAFFTACLCAVGLLAIAGLWH